MVPFCPFCFGVSLLQLNSRKKGTLILNGLLGNLVIGGHLNSATSLKVCSSQLGCLTVVKIILEVVV